MKKKFLLGLCLWLAFNGCATLIRLWAQAQGLYVGSTVQITAMIVLPVIVGLIAARQLPVKICVLLVAMSITSLLFSLGVFVGLLLVNLVVAYWLACLGLFLLDLISANLIVRFFCEKVEMLTEPHLWQ